MQSLQSFMLSIRWLRFAILLLALLAAGAFARELPPTAAWPHETADIQPDPSVVWGRLDNGMRYALLPNSTPTNRVSLRLLVAAGSLMEREDERGLAHFLEHMAFKGSENMPAGDLMQYLERLGMAFGADTNAATSFDSTVYKLELPSQDPELLDRSLFVLREMVDRMLIPGAEVDKERGVILSERRLRDTAQYRAFVAGVEFALPESRIARRWPIGLESVIQTAPRERLVEFYRSYYTPARTTLIAVGAIEPGAFAQLIHKHFDSFRALGTEGADPDLGRIRPRGLEARLHYEPEGRTTVSLAVAKPLEPGPDVRPRRLEQAALYLANAVISRRLATLAQKPDAGFLAGAAQSHDFQNFSRIGFVLMDTQPDQWRKALAAAETELRRALTHGFTAAELEEQKKDLLAQFDEAARGAGTRESSTLADALVLDLTERRVFTHPDQDLREVTEILAQVTPEKALAELRALWADAGPLIFLSGPVQLDDAQAAIANVYLASRAQPVAPPADNAVAKFAYTEFGKRTGVVERGVSEALQVTQLRFANNVRVNLKRTPFEANSVLVAARVGGGRLDLPRDKPGLKQLADGTFLAGGLVAHNIDEINRITAGHVVGLDFDVDDDAFVLSGRTVPGDLRLQLQLMAAYITAPGYRPESLDRFRQGLPQLYQSLDRTPIGIMQRDVTRFLRGGDDRFGYPARPALASLTLDDLRAALSGPLASGYLELSVVGDIDIEAAIDAVADTFGSLPQRVAAKIDYGNARAVRFPEKRQLTTFVYDTVDPKALAAVYWPTTDFSRVSEVRRLFVLAKVLGSRVLERVRNEQGLTYTAQGDHAPSHAFPGFGFLYAIVDAPPERARELAEQIRAIGADIYRNGVTQDELERARNPVVSELRRLLETNSYLLSALISGSQENPEKLKRGTTSLAELQSLTVEDLNLVARKYLAPEAALPVVIVPRDQPGPKASLRRREGLAWADQLALARASAWVSDVSMSTGKTMVLLLSPAMIASVCR
jgi:zinc protease